MSQSIYREELNQPTREVLEQDLGDTSVLLDEITTSLTMNTVNASLSGNSITRNQAGL